MNAPRRKQLGRRRRRRLRFLRAGQGARQGAPRRDRRGAAPGGRNLVHEGGQLGRGRRGHGMGRALGRSLGRSAAPAPASAARGRASAVSRRAGPLALGAVLRSAVLRSAVLRNAVLQNAVLRRSAVLPTQKGPVPKALDGSLTLAAAAARVLPNLQGVVLLFLAKYRVSKKKNMFGATHPHELRRVKPSTTKLQKAEPARHHKGMRRFMKTRSERLRTVFKCMF